MTEGQVKSTSVCKENAESNILRPWPRAGGGWAGDLMIVEYEDVQESEASDIYVKRSRIPEVFVSIESSYSSKTVIVNGLMEGNFLQEDYVQKREPQQKSCGP